MTRRYLRLVFQLVFSLMPYFTLSHHCLLECLTSRASGQEHKDTRKRAHSLYMNEGYICPWYTKALIIVPWLVGEYRVCDSTTIRTCLRGICVSV